MECLTKIADFDYYCLTDMGLQPKDEKQVLFSFLQSGELFSLTEVKGGDRFHKVLLCYRLDFNI